MNPTTNSSSFSFCQIVGEGGPDDWENDSPPGGVDGGIFVEEVEDIINDALNEPSKATKLERVLSAVAVEQNKPSTWVNAVIYKFGKIGIFTIAKLHELLPTLNQRLKIGNFPIFHRTI